ncbi:hypothetical protein QFZ22_007592 [Streptomyces canus]|uniref:Uncharacterized protein n=1 Tax=Streptomyces canus TaxID=58343 RepID=A0AAW8FPA9_9ACTN|nr:hypothetical protein [Streptomyces canus]
MAAEHTNSDAGLAIGAGSRRTRGAGTGCPAPGGAGLPLPLLLMVADMIPSQLAPVPQFVTMVEFDWAGTLKALIIPGGLYVLHQGTPVGFGVIRSCWGHAASSTSAGVRDS